MGLLAGEGPWAAGPLAAGLLAAGPLAAALWALVGLRPLMVMLVLAPWSERLCLKAVSVRGEEALPWLSCCLDGVAVPDGCVHLHDEHRILMVTDTVTNTVILLVILYGNSNKTVTVIMTITVAGKNGELGMYRAILVLPHSWSICYRSTPVSAFLGVERLGRGARIQILMLRQTI